VDASSLWSLRYLMGQWRPTIGDPTFMGWFTVASYFACAVPTLIAALSHQKTDRRSFCFWNIVSVLMVLLAINKQLDLQSLLTEIGRQIAKHQGWMEQRRAVQLWFIGFFGSISMAAFLFFAFTMRNLFRRFMLAFIGLFFLLSFIIVRAASFHHVEEFLDLTLVDVRMNWLFELTGIYTVFVAALLDTVRSRSLTGDRNT
jgi:hypothetical protein